jgi:hypothetical protein
MFVQAILAAILILLLWFLLTDSDQPAEDEVRSANPPPMSPHPQSVDVSPEPTRRTEPAA